MKSVQVFKLQQVKCKSKGETYRHVTPKAKPQGAKKKPGRFLAYQKRSEKKI